MLKWMLSSSCHLQINLRRWVANEAKKLTKPINTRFFIFALAFVVALTTGAPPPAAWAKEVRAANYFGESIMPDAERQRLAHRLLGKSRLNDLEVDDYYARVAKRLRPDDEFLITTSDSEHVNAFAYYSGILVFYKGLWKFAKSEDEFIGILAHEMAHITQGHYEATQENAKQASAITTPLLIAGILVDNPEFSEALISGSIGLLNDQLLSYSRELEHEADTIAFDYLIDAQYSPEGMVEIFKRFGGNAAEYLSSHPASDRRSSYLLNRLHQEKELSFLPNTLDFLLLQEKLSLKKDVLRADVRQQQHKIDKAKTPEKKLAAQYGMLLLATKLRFRPLGKQMVEELKNETHPYIARALAENLMLRGEYEAAQNFLTPAIAAHPEQAALAHSQLLLYEYSMQYKAGLAFYDALPESLQANIEVLFQAGRLASYAEQHVLANYLLTYGHAQNGYFERALSQTEIAERFGGGDAKTLLELSRLKKNLKEELKLMQEQRVNAQ